MILKNINWESIKGKPDAFMSKAVMFAERWVEKIENAVSAGESMGDAIDRCGRDAKREVIDEYVYQAAVGLIYSCWEKGKADRFAEWYRRKYGQDLKEWPTLLKPPRRVYTATPEEMTRLGITPEDMGKG